MKISVLGSGSGGNATLVSSGRTTVLVDAGFGPRVLAKRCAAAGVEPSAIAAIFITHEHSDHRIGALDFAETFGIPIFCSRGTADALGLDGSLFAQYVPIHAEREGRIGDLAFRAYATPHDATDGSVSAPFTHTGPVMGTTLPRAICGPSTRSPAIRRPAWSPT